MTKEELLRENQELKDRVIELQSEVIRLQPYYPQYPMPSDSGTGDPLPFLFETTCVRNAMEWDESRKAFI